MNNSKSQVLNVTDVAAVLGHAVVRNGATGPDGVKDESNWIGGFPGESQFYFDHIKAGVEFAAGHPGTCLMFSGGQTRVAAGPRSEAESYWEVARDHDWFGHPTVANTSLKEEFARDSLENLAFCLALFHQRTGSWPNSLTVIGWRFKQPRFELHRTALKWPPSRFKYLGVNDPPSDALPAAEAGEQAKLQSVKSDLFLAGRQWASQREMRDPFGRSHPYGGVDAGLDALISLMSGNSLRSRFGWIGTPVERH